MVVIANRLDRAMAAVTDESPAAVERAATEALNHAVTADRVAAAVAAEHVGDRIATLSRSGTVRAVAAAAAPRLCSSPSHGPAVKASASPRRLLRAPR
ncbi:hypothetical protein C9J85_11435 [Haloferax sp. wsp5]|nr:hypothetical protein C9J85_11435 [Haloferax sp. wsp5]